MVELPETGQRAPLTDYATARLRVVIPFSADGPFYRRCGFQFSLFYRRCGFQFSLHPVQLSVADLAPDIDAAIETLIEIAGDKKLSATLIHHDETELELGDAEIAAIRVDLAAVRASLVRCKHCGRAIDQ